MKNSHTFCPGDWWAFRIQDMVENSFDLKTDVGPERKGDVRGPKLERVQMGPREQAKSTGSLRTFKLCEKRENGNSGERARFMNSLHLRATKEMQQVSFSWSIPTNIWRYLQLEYNNFASPNEIINLAIDNCVSYQFIAPRPPIHPLIHALW